MVNAQNIHIVESPAMPLSQRMINVLGTGSDGWGIYYTTRTLVASGVPVLNLTIGEHDIRTDPAILAAMDASARAGNTGYAFGPGKTDLRTAIAARVQARTGVPTHWTNVIITPGGQSGLFSSHMVLLDAGDTALHCDPYYATYPGTIRSVGAVPVAIPTLPENAFEPAAADIAARAHGAKTLLINSPNNPTGVVYSRKTLQGIADVVLDSDLWLISDEVYDTQIWGGTHLSPRALPGMADRTLVVGSMSKSHAMTGSRLGWVIGPERVIDAITLLATNTTYGVPAFVQDAALFALAQGPAFEAEIAAPFRRRRAIAQGLLATQNVLRLIPSSGAMYLMLDIRATGLSGDDFASALLADERIAVMPGESFGASSAGHIRVAMTIADDLFADALSRLIRFAQTRCVADPR